MNFAFSDALNQVRAEAKNVLATHAAGSARRALEQHAGFDADLWNRVRALGWLGAAIPEAHGGIGLEDEGLCVLAEEIGASLAAIPFASSAYLASQAILRHGSPAQHAAWLPRLADGTAIGAFALAEGPGQPSPAGIATTFDGRHLTGKKTPVIDGGIAHLALVAARDQAGEIVLCVADLAAVARTPVETIDGSRNAAHLHFDAAPAERLANANGWSAVEQVLDRAAAFMAFEQLGGAEAALHHARDYALERHAFGRPIGGFQAIKHKLADVYIATELARSNAYYAAWALATNAPDLTTAAAAARVAATRAFEFAAQENIQVHGGMGFTWESDCHLFYRRAKHLALALGSAPFWKDRLVASIERRNT